MSTLTLTIIEQPEGQTVSTTRYSFNESGGTIGRNPSTSDWVINDEERIVSKEHATIVYEQGQFRIQDRSGNGTYLHPQGDRVCAEQGTVLLDGQCLDIGDFIIRAKVELESTAAKPKPSNTETQAFNPFSLPESKQSQSKQSESKQEPINTVNGLSGVPEREMHNQSDLPAANHSPQKEPQPVNKKPQPVKEPQRSKKEAQAPIPQTPIPQTQQTTTQTHHSNSECKPASKKPQIVDEEATLQALAATLNDHDAEQFNRIIGATTARLVNFFKRINKVREEFSLPTDRIGEANNNPIRLYPVEVAMKMLLENSTGHMEADEAYSDALQEAIKHHDAMLAGMEAVYDNMLETFSPAKLRKRLSKSQSSSWLDNLRGKDDFLNAYEAYYNALTRNQDRCFETLFSQAFKKGYLRHSQQYSQQHSQQHPQQHSQSTRTNQEEVL